MGEDLMKKNKMGNDMYALGLKLWLQGIFAISFWGGKIQNHYVLHHLQLKAGETLGAKFSPRALLFLSSLGWGLATLGSHLTSIVDHSSCGSNLTSRLSFLCSQINVILGAHNIRTLESTQQRIPVLRSIPHPRYSQQNKSNDIMLLQVPTLWFFSWAARSQPGGLPVSWDQGGGKPGRLPGQWRARAGMGWV